MKTDLSGVCLAALALTVGAWGLAGLLLEHAVECLHAQKTGLLHNFGNVVVRIDQ